MQTIEFNFPPTVARHYVDEWVKHVEQDEKADGQMKKILQDVKTLVDLAVKQLKVETKDAKKCSN